MASGKLAARKLILLVRKESGGLWCLAWVCDSGGTAWLIIVHQGFIQYRAGEAFVPSAHGFQLQHESFDRNLCKVKQ